MGELTVWICGELPVWLMGELPVWLMGELTVWLMGELTVWLMGELTVWLMGELTVWICGELPVWLMGELTVWLMGECNSPLRSTSKILIIPCIWLGITINSPNSILGRISGVFIHSLYAICPNVFNTILPFSICPNMHCLFSQHNVIKYKPGLL
jgi:hypothetical protein